MMNVAEWAEAQHIHAQTAYRWFRARKLPVPVERVGGLILVGDLTDTQPQSSAKTAIDPRVSSADQTSDLDRQVARVTAWATKSHGYSVDSVVTEVGSARKPSAAGSSGSSRTPREPRSSSNIGTASPGSGPSTWPAPWTPAVAAWWESMKEKSTMTWCGT